MTPKKTGERRKKRFSAPFCVRSIKHEVLTIKFPKKGKRRKCFVYRIMRCWCAKKKLRHCGGIERHWWWLRWSMIIEWSWSGGGGGADEHQNPFQHGKKWQKNIPKEVLFSFLSFNDFLRSRCRRFCLSRLVAKIFPFCQKDLPYLMLLLLSPFISGWLFGCT